MYTVTIWDLYEMYTGLRKLTPVVTSSRGIDILFPGVEVKQKWRRVEIDLLKEKPKKDTQLHLSILLAYNVFGWGVRVDQIVTDRPTVWEPNTGPLTYDGGKYLFLPNPYSRLRWPVKETLEEGFILLYRVHLSKPRWMSDMCPPERCRHLKLRLNSNRLET